MNGKIIIKTPFMCDCRVLIDGVTKTLNPFKKTQLIELPYGKHYINVSINYDEMPESSKVYGADAWAWENDKEINVSENNIYIEIKRKWHLLKPVTTEAKIEGGE